MATITPIGGSGVANLPNPSQGTLPGNALPEDGTQWGATVAEESAGDSSFSFDTYAASIASDMLSHGYTSTATEQFVNAMYAGYLASGGMATAQATGNVGASSFSLAGLYSPSIGAGTLSLPGSNGEPAISTGSHGSFPLNASTAAGIGQRLASSNSLDYRQWRANMEADLTSAGYSPTEVQSFLASVDSGFYGASPNNIVNLGISMGSSLVGISNSNDLEYYITNQVVPYLQQRGFSADQINQYDDGLRAGFYGSTSGNSNLVNLGLVQGQELASQQLGSGANFDFDTYSASAASQMQAAGYSEVAIATYLNAMSAGYLRGGGVSTSEATVITTFSTNGTSVTSGTGGSGSVNTGGSGTGGTGSGNTQTGPSINIITPSYRETGVYTSIERNPPNAALSTDVVNVRAAENNLSTAAATYQSNPNSTTLQNLQTSWLAARNAEAQFWSDLSAVSTEFSSQAATISASFHSNGWYTLEGEMPHEWAAGSTPAPLSTAIVGSLMNLAASSQLGAGVSLPTSLASIVTNPTALSSMSEGDFESIAEGLVALYQKNPAEYYAALQSITDPNLRSTLNYAVQDVITNGADSLVQNGASVQKENATFSMYFNNAHANPSTYAAWNPTGTVTASTGTGLDAIPGNTADINNIRSFLSNSTVSGSPPAQFAETADMLAQLWKSNPAAYYQVLSGVANPNLRNALNTVVQLESTQNPQNIGTDRAKNDYNGLYNTWFNHTGPGASSAMSTVTHLNTSSPTGGR